LDTTFGSRHLRLRARALAVDHGPAFGSWSVAPRKREDLLDRMTADFEPADELAAPERVVVDSTAAIDEVLARVLESR
jgi:hypothetical protein